MWQSNDCWAVVLPGALSCAAWGPHTVPTLYVHVVGTEQALIAVGDAVRAADGADGLAADQHLFALLICGVGVCTAVHLPEESQQGEKTYNIHNCHFGWDTDLVQPALTVPAQISAEGPAELVFCNWWVLPAEMSPQSRRGGGGGGGWKSYNHAAPQMG